MKCGSRGDHQRTRDRYRPAPLVNGNRKSWAFGVVILWRHSVIPEVNFLFSPAQLLPFASGPSASLVLLYQFSVTLSGMFPPFHLRYRWASSLCSFILI